MAGIGQFHKALARRAPQITLRPLESPRLRAIIEKALAEVPRSCRDHPLQPELVMWLVLALSLWRDKSILEAFELLLDPWRDGSIPRGCVGDDALAHARERLGSAPVRQMFEGVSQAQQPPPTFHGRRVRALDGVRLALPDSPANAAYFGRPPSHGKKGVPRPQALVVTLNDVATHRTRAAAISPCNRGERDLGLELLRCLSPGDLVLADRGFYSAPMARDIEAMGLEDLVRLPASVQPHVLRELSPGDYEVEIRTNYHREGPRKNGRRQQLERKEKVRFRARMIVYREHGGGELVRLLTDVWDVTAIELALGYHLRWEVELTYDEIETHLSSARRGNPDTAVRGKSPVLVEQEIWGLLTLHNLLRDEMTAAARASESEPLRLSFVGCVEILRSAAAHRGGRSPRVLARLRAQVRRDMARTRMDRWRRPRRCPRVVRARWNPFPGKQPDQRCVAYEFRVDLVPWERAA